MIVQEGVYMSKKYKTVSCYLHNGNATMQEFTQYVSRKKNKRRKAI